MAISFFCGKSLCIGIATVLLCLATTIDISLPAPFPSCSSVNVTSDPTVQDHIEQVIGGLEILIGLGSRLNTTLLHIPDFQSMELGVKMVCYMYDLYAHFTTMQAALPTGLMNAQGTNFSSHQFVAWKVMQSACQWAKTSGSTLPNDCSLVSIASTCYSFDHKRLIFNNRLQVGCAIGHGVPISTELWISRNNVPTSIADYISDV